MRSSRLPRALRDIVTLTLASTAAYACAGDLGSDMEAACVGNASTTSVAGFRPGTPVDFIVRRSESVVLTEGAAAQVNVSEMERTGEPCKTAGDREACQKKLDEFHLVDGTTCRIDQTQVSPASAGRVNCDAVYMLFTRGDQIVALKTAEEIENFLRPIDTKEEAFFLATSTGRLSASCGVEEPKWRETDDGFELLVFDWQGSCSPSGGKIDRVVVRVSSDGNVSEVEREKARDVGPCSEGRRPRGLRSNGRARRPCSNLGAYFAKASHLEAASVVAFAQLERELTALGAPPTLTRALAKARADEVRHADVTARLAERFGATPPSVRVKCGRNRSALAIAIENAREGCVRETLGAVVALYRAHRATDPEVAQAMSAIAEDELRHARLSWRLMEWLDARLTERGRVAVRRAFEREIAALATELRDPPADVAAIAGAPSAATLRALFERVESDVWRPAFAA